MVTNIELEKYLNTMMKIKDFEDYVPNGLQIEGSHQIQRLICSPSISMEVINRAIEFKAQCILVHHGLFWKNESRILRGNYKKKIQSLLDHEINLFAYHLPMDFLPKFGNNEPVLKDFQIRKIKPFAGIGYQGIFRSSLDSKDFSKSLDSYYNTEGTHIPRNGKIVKIAIVSGNGTSYFQKAIDEGVDAFITGEGTEWIYQLAKDNNIAFSAMGHYKSECVGPKLLAKHLEKKFKLECEFFAVANPF